MTALFLSLLAASLAIVEGIDGTRSSANQTAGGVFGPNDPGLYPGLRSVQELGLPGSRSTDAGVGVYPALTSPGALTFPRPLAVEAARRYAATRQGVISFAVADARGGVAGLDVDRPFSSASLVKAMMLVAYLQQIDRERRPLTPADNFRMDAMIRVSDNDSASWIFHRIGAEGLLQVARQSGMRAFSVGSVWGNARVTAADQARLFLAIDRLLPGSQRAYGRYLLQSVAPFQTWGIPAVARPRWRVLFKGGWRPDAAGDIVHQGALLERGARRFAIAVLTDGSPSEDYGHETVRGIALRLLQPAPLLPALPAAAPGRLSPLPALKGYHAPGPKPLRPLTAAS